MHTVKQHMIRKTIIGLALVLGTMSTIFAAVTYDASTQSRATKMMDTARSNATRLSPADKKIYYSLVSSKIQSLIQVLTILDASLMSEIAQINVGSTVCTTEYAPVCGSISVQCITTPCNPIRQTFSNRCVAQSQNATGLVTGTCESGTLNPGTNTNTNTTYIKNQTKKCVESEKSYYWFDSNNQKTDLIKKCSIPPNGGLSCSEGAGGCCPEGQTAINGKCITPVSVGEYCYATSGCKIGLSCNNNKCINPQVQSCLSYQIKLPNGNCDSCPSGQTPNSLATSCVTQVTPTISLKVNGASSIDIERGVPLNFTWSSNVNVTNCRLGAGFSNNSNITPSSGNAGSISQQISASPVTNSPMDYDYNLSCLYDGGLLWSTARVKVLPPADPYLKYDYNLGQGACILTDAPTVYLTTSGYVGLVGANTNTLGNGKMYKGCLNLCDSTYKNNYNNSGTMYCHYEGRNGKSYPNGAVIDVKNVALPEIPRKITLSSSDSSCNTAISNKENCTCTVAIGQSSCGINFKWTTQGYSSVETFTKVGVDSIIIGGSSDLSQLNSGLTRVSSAPSGETTLVASASQTSNTSNMSIIAFGLANGSTTGGNTWALKATCASGSAWDGAICRATGLGSICPSGSMWDGGKCTNTTTAAISCPAGQNFSYYNTSYSIGDQGGTPCTATTPSGIYSPSGGTTIVYASQSLSSVMLYCGGDGKWYAGSYPSGNNIGLMTYPSIPAYGSSNSNSYRVEDSISRGVALQLGWASCRGH